MAHDAASRLYAAAEAGREPVRAFLTAFMAGVYTRAFGAVAIAGGRATSEQDAVDAALIAPRDADLITSLFEDGGGEACLVHVADLKELLADYGKLKADAEKRATPAYQPPKNTGHGWVYPREDGVRMRCGGPRLCSVCATQAARKAGE